MLRFIGQRLLFISAVAIFIVYAVNLGMAMTPNSEVATPNYDLVRTSKSAWQATRHFFSAARQGDLGIIETDYGLVRVTDFLAVSYLNSLGLLLIALAVAGILGIGLGCWAALTGRSSVTLSFLMLTLVGISVPSFFLALLLQQGAIRYQQIFAQRLASVSGYGWDYQHLLFPVIVLAARPLAYLTRTTFIELQRIMQADFIRTAYAKGLGRFRAVVGHALRNMGVPLLTAVGVSLRFSLSTLPVVEFFFNWPGIGKQLLEAINNRQTDVVVAMALLLGLTFLLVNLLLDLLYRWVDPRTRDEPELVGVI